MAILTVENIEKSYRIKKDKKRTKLMAVNNVSFEIKKGSCVGLVGESGCGKSTLGRIINGLEKADAGKILIDGVDIHEKSRKELSCRVQMVFQDSYDAVNPRYTASQIVEEPLKNLTKLNKTEREEKIRKHLSEVGISESEWNKYGMEFSGGQLQRVCIARALAAEPDMIVLDEPLSSLDVSVQAQILNLLHDIQKEKELTYLLVSHDLEAVYYLADVIIVMYGGQIMEKIDSMDYFNRMQHPYTRMLLASVPGYEDAGGERENNRTIYKDMGTQLEGFMGCPYCGRCRFATERCWNERPVLQEVEKGHYIACHKETSHAD